MARASWMMPDPAEVPAQVHVEKGDREALIARLLDQRRVGRTYQRIHDDLTEDEVRLLMPYGLGGSDWTDVRRILKGAEATIAAAR